MSQPGWYPDPDGTMGRFRYWDGQAWSAQTTTDPRSSRPGDQPAGGRSIGRIALLIGAVIVVAAVAVGIAVVRWTGNEDPPTSGPLPSSTVSGWDDSSPIPSPTPTPTPTPSPSAAEPSGSDICPYGDPTDLADHPDDGRVHGGRFSYGQIDTYTDPAPFPATLTWFYDVTAQTQTTEPGWWSWFAVGEVERDEAFDSPKQAAIHSMECIATTDGFTGYSGRTDLRNEAITIDGKKGWIVQSEVRVDRDDVSVDGDVVTFIFVDDGRSDRLSGFCGMSPIGDEVRGEIAAKVIRSLQVG